MIAVVDYGVGNLYSLQCSLRYIGQQAQVTRLEDELRDASAIILPGVGAFGDAAAKLRELRLDRLLQEMVDKGKPLMGICLGMQLLFEESLEYGKHEGLGLISGVVKPLADALPQGMKVPHIGWNSLDIRCPDDPLLRGCQQDSYVYYVHSYYVTQCEHAVMASSSYGGVHIPGVVRNHKVCGTQFHPEKSGEVGLGMLSAFAKGGF